MTVEGYGTVLYTLKDEHAVHADIFKQMIKGETKVNFVATGEKKKGMVVVKVISLVEEVEPEMVDV